MCPFGFSTLCVRCACVCVNVSIRYSSTKNLSEAENVCCFLLSYRRVHTCKAFAISVDQASFSWGKTPIPTLRK